MLNVDDYAMLMNVKSPLQLVKVLRKDKFLNIEVMFSDLVHGQSQGGRSGWGFWGDMAHWQLALLGGQSVQLSLFKNENKSTKLICKKICISKHMYPKKWIRTNVSKQLFTITTVSKQQYPIKLIYRSVSQVNCIETNVPTVLSLKLIYPNKCIKTSIA